MSGRTGPVDPLDPVAAAAAERRPVPVGEIAAADREDRYEQMLRLADVLDDAGDQLREWARAGAAVLTEADVADSAELSTTSWARAEEEIRAATTGRSGLMSRSGELDADALVLRATVLTYRWIDDLQEAAYDNLGAIVGRAIGYLAPEVALGGAIVAAGLIETDALDRDGVAAYLGELAEANPELMEHVTTGGGLVDSLQMRTLLTAGVLAGDAGGPARRGGLRASGIGDFDGGFGAALRDAAVGIRDPDQTGGAAAARADATTSPGGLGDLMAGLVTAGTPIVLRWTGADRLVVYLPGPVRTGPTGGRLRLVSGDHSRYADDALAVLREACRGADGVEVLLVGEGPGGAAALRIAERAAEAGVRVTHAVIANAPAAAVPRLPEGLRVIALEDRSDPVAVLGSLVNAGDPNRLTVVYDGTEDETATSPLVAGGRIADRADDPRLRAALAALRERGYLSGRSE